jgi:diadenosine tetraphosphatase ApaH/serine/threonine PP2A family protein phosphatase
MLYAIISDIHGNREALEAVFAAIDAMPVDAVLCLGDIVGYNPDPGACLQAVMSRARLVIRGNHDRAVAGLMDLSWFNRVAREAALWTRENLGPEALAAVRGLPAGPLEAEDGILLCHGTPYDEDAYLMDGASAERSFTALQGMFPSVGVCFVGHTHYPLALARRRNGGPRGRGPREPVTESGTLELRDGEVYVINPGSVGQPRDGNPRASFGILDTQRRQYRNLRVAYDIAETQRKILESGLPPELARRLAEGR